MVLIVLDFSVIEANILLSYNKSNWSGTISSGGWYHKCSSRPAWCASDAPAIRQRLRTLQPPDGDIPDELPTKKPYGEILIVWLFVVLIRCFYSFTNFCNPT